MDPKILLQVLSLIIVAVGGHTLHRSNQIGSIKDDCKLKSIVSSIKEALGLAILENCLEESLNGECTQIAISALRPCLSISNSKSDYIDLHCLSNVFKSSQSEEYGDGECLCGGLSELVISLGTVTPLLCPQHTSPRVGRMLGGSWHGSSSRPMIIDTDMANNVNDPLALCAAHAIEKEGYGRIMAVVSNVGYPKIIGAVSVVNHYFGRDHIKLGAYKGKFGNDFSGFYVDDLVDNFPSPVKNYDAVDDAVNTIRETLAEAENDSIVYVVIGFMINLRDFLAEAENRELFARKVNTVYIMGGQYDPESQTPEFHFGCGVVDRVDTFSNTLQCRGSAKEAIENIPDSVPVRFVGQEVGEDVWTGGSLWSYCKSYDSLKNPCFRALQDWESHTGNTSTLSWDPITVTAAAASVFTVGSVLEGWNGKIQVEEDGTNTWEEGFSDSNQLYLVKENKYLAKAQIEKLYCMSNIFFKNK